MGEATQAPLGPVVEVSSRRFAYPAQCPCCGAAPDSELRVPVTPTPGRDVAADSASALEFPYCQRCVAHVKRWHDAGVVPTGIALAGLITGIVLAFVMSILIGALVAVAAIFVAYGLINHRRGQVLAACGPSCASPDVAVAYHGWTGKSSAFAFRSHAYTARFAEDNTVLLCQITPQLKRLLDGNRVARLQVPTPAASMAVPPPRSAKAWIEKIERGTSRVGRLTDTQIALDLTGEDAEKQDILRAATKAEMAPIHAKLGKLSGGARTSYLEQKMIELAADNMPPELQRAVLAELEALLR